MNFHDDYKAVLSALLDGELSDSERSEVLAHLDSCEECRAYLAELTALRDALGEIEPVDTPDGFAAGVLARLHEEETSKTVKKFNPRKRYGALAACAAVVVLAAAVLPNALRMGSAKSSSTDSAAPEAAMVTENFVMTTMTAGGAAESEESVEDADMNAALYAMDTNENTTASDASTAAPEARDAGGDTSQTAADAQIVTGAAANAKHGDDVLTLCGEGAEAWLTEHGTWDEDGEYYLVSVAALNELPGNLMLEGVIEPVDDMVPVVLAETEAQP